MKTQAHAVGFTATAPSFFAGLTVTNFWKAIMVARERRALREMPESVLKDIGLTRAEAEREAARPFWDLPYGR
ncbi:MAG: DUF1127 domain-containing protein [Pseudomonadota bacterium]